jgi:hypothetical protein
LTYSQTWNTATGPETFNINSDLYYVIYSPEIQNAILAPTPASPVGPVQDISTQYYWVRTYSHWLKLLNQTLQDAWGLPGGVPPLSVYRKFSDEWVARGLSAHTAFPFPTEQSWLEYIASPVINYSPTSRLFTLEGDASAFGQYVNPSPGGGPFVPTPISPSAAWNIATTYAANDQVVYSGLAYNSIAGGNIGNQPDISPGDWAPVPFTAGAQTPAIAQLFFNNNTYNLFANFEAIYYNSPTGSAFPNALPAGFVWEIQFTNKNWENLVDYTQAPYNQYVPLAFQKRWWQCTQDYISIDNLWSPCGSIVFTTTLIPIRAEQTTAPVIFGENNLGNSAPTTQAAFVPIITDIAIPLGGEGAQAYRSFIYYTPTAEYRMGDFGPSQQEVRNIDIQVFWRNRMNNQLYPLSIPNGGSVNFKLMFRHRRLG